MFTSGFFNSLNGDRKYDTEQISSLFDGIIADGVFANVGEQFAVVPGSGMDVIVKTGRAWFNHTWSLNDTWMRLTVDGPDPLRPRIDSVVLEVDSTPLVRANSIKIVKGTPSSAPLPPVMQHTDELNQYRLANITVGAGATTLTTANIQSTVGMMECPFVTAPIKSVDVSVLFQQWDGQFQEWFENVKGQLSGDIASNLQKQVDERVKIEDKATSEDLVNGTPGKWLDAELASGALSGGITSNLKIGDIVYSKRDLEAETNGMMIKCDQRRLNKNDYPELCSLDNIKYRRDYDIDSTFLISDVAQGSVTDIGTAQMYYYNDYIYGFGYKELGSTSFSFSLHRCSLESLVKRAPIFTQVWDSGTINVTASSGLSSKFSRTYYKICDKLIYVSVEYYTTAYLINLETNTVTNVTKFSTAPYTLLPYLEDNSGNYYLYVYGVSNGNCTRTKYTLDMTLKTHTTSTEVIMPCPYDSTQFISSQDTKGAILNDTIVITSYIFDNTTYPNSTRITGLYVMVFNTRTGILSHTHYAPSDVGLDKLNVSGTKSGSPFTTCSFNENNIITSISIGYNDSPIPSGVLISINRATMKVSTYKNFTGAESYKLDNVLLYYYNSQSGFKNLTYGTPIYNPDRTAIMMPGFLYTNAVKRHVLLRVSLDDTMDVSIIYGKYSWMPEIYAYSATNSFAKDQYYPGLVTIYYYENSYSSEYEIYPKSYTSTSDQYKPRSYLLDWDHMFTANAYALDSYAKATIYDVRPCGKYIVYIMSLSSTNPLMIVDDDIRIAPYIRNAYIKAKN